MRKCSICKKEKSLGSFHKNCYRCKPCNLLYVREHYERNRENIKAYSRSHYRENAENYRQYDRSRYHNDPKRMAAQKSQSRKWQKENRERVNELSNSRNYTAGRRFSLQKHMAIHRYRREWSLTKDKFVELVEKPCTYCGERKNSMGVGLDRIDNSKGYTIDNVLPCCGDCNQLRGHRLTVEETRVAMAAILAYRKKER